MHRHQRSKLKAMAALAEEADASLDREDVSASIDPCFAFRVPPAAREGHKAAVWKEAGHVWTGKLGEFAAGDGTAPPRSSYLHGDADLPLVLPTLAAPSTAPPPRPASRPTPHPAEVVTTIRTNRCMLKLINPDGKPFAIFPIKAPGSDGPKSIERTIDSGRYFAILIEDPKTKRRSNIGIGFSERAQAFEFNVAIQRWEEQYKREEQGEKLLVSSESSLQKLQAESGASKITINIGGRKKKGKADSSAAKKDAAATAAGGGGGGGGLMAPPSAGGLKAPGGGGRRRRGRKKAPSSTTSALTAAAPSTATASTATSAASADPFA